MAACPARQDAHDANTIVALCQGRAGVPVNPLEWQRGGSGELRTTEVTMHEESGNKTRSDERGNVRPAAAPAIRTVLICGYGLMGRGVAMTFAAAGFRTRIFSRRADSLVADLPRGVKAVSRLEQLDDEAPDLAIEFAPEDVEAKQAVYRQLEEAYPGAGPIIATGTSGLDLVRLASTLIRPERFVGMHYFMPADSSPLVEVMSCLLYTSP